LGQSMAPRAARVSRSSWSRRLRHWLGLGAPRRPPAPRRLALNGLEERVVMATNLDLYLHVPGLQGGSHDTVNRGAFEVLGDFSFRALGAGAGSSANAGPELSEIGITLFRGPD